MQFILQQIICISYQLLDAVLCVADGVQLLQPKGAGGVGRGPAGQHCVPGILKPDQGRQGPLPVRAEHPLPQEVGGDRGAILRRKDQHDDGPGGRLGLLLLLPVLDDQVRG